MTESQETSIELTNGQRIKAEFVKLVSTPVMVDLAVYQLPDGSEVVCLRGEGEPVEVEESYLRVLGVAV